MKTLAALLTLFAASAIFSAITISNVHVDSLKDTAVAYGNIWRGIVTFDVASDSDSVYTWLEFSSDNGATWRIDNIHAVGYVGTIPRGTGLKARWMVDGDKGPGCKIRVRVNDQPKWYVRNEVTLFDTASETAQDCPKPIPTDDPYETIERMVNNKWQDMILPRAEYKLPYYDATYFSYPQVPLDIKTSVTAGSDFLVGMARVRRGTTCYGASEHYIWATYFRLGGKEFAVISKNCIRQETDTINLIKKTVRDTLGIPEGDVLVNWDHTHYTDCGEPLLDSTLSAIRKAKAVARPARMAHVRISLGAGYNVRRVSASPAGMTDGPIDGNLYGVFFRDTSGAPIGAWARFTGHHGQTPRAICLLMEQRFGAPCAFMQGGAGTCCMWDSYVASSNPASGRPATVSDTFMVRKLLSAESALVYSPVARMGTACAVDGIPGIGVSLVSAWIIGDLAIPCYTAEASMEQMLYTFARLNNDDNVMPIGYSQGGGGSYYNWGHDLTSVNDPIAWPNHDSKGSILRNSEATVRCVNILKNLLN